MIATLVLVLLVAAQLAFQAGWIVAVVVPLAALVAAALGLAARMMLRRLNKNLTTYCVTVLVMPISDTLRSEIRSNAHLMTRWIDVTNCTFIVAGSLTSPPVAGRVAPAGSSSGRVPISLTSHRAEP